MFPDAQGIALPETGGKLNINIGYTRNLRDKIPKELQSNDFEVVAQYAKKNFKAFDLVDYDNSGYDSVGIKLVWFTVTFIILSKLALLLWETQRTRLVHLSAWG